MSHARYISVTTPTRQNEAITFKHVYLIQVEYLQVDNRKLTEMQSTINQYIKQFPTNKLLYLL